jgi:predicted RNase H-like HicB family nuclease
MKDKRMEYVVIYEKGDNSYGAYVPDLPGCITVGETLEEVQTLIDEAIEFHIEGLQEDGDDVPQPSSNILVQYDIPYLGIHKVVENYVHNDDPALFSCKDCAGHLYLVTVGKNDEHKTWLRVGISNERFNLIRSGGIDLRNAFTDAENGSLFQVNIPNDDPTEPSLEVVQPNQIVEDMLPLPGERLGLKTDTLPALSNPDEIAASRVRELFKCAINYLGVFRTEAPVESLGKTLTGLQKIINRIGAKCVNSTYKKILEDIRNPFGISMLDVGEGSFEIQLASTEYVGILKESDLGNAINEFLKILNSGCNQDQLKPLMERFGPRVAKDYTEFLKPLSESAIDTRFTWTSPHPDRGGTAQLSQSQMIKTIDILEKIQEETLKTIRIPGTLVGISLRSKSFEIETTNENYYEKDFFKGKITDEAYETETVRNATVSKIYIAEIQGYAEIGETKDETNIKFRLLSLSQ